MPTQLSTARLNKTRFPVVYFLTTSQSSGWQWGAHLHRRRLLRGGLLRRLLGWRRLFRLWSFLPSLDRALDCFGLLGWRLQRGACAVRLVSTAPTARTAGIPVYTGIYNWGSRSSGRVRVRGLPLQLRRRPGKLYTRSTMDLYRLKHIPLVVKLSQIKSYSYSYSAPWASWQRPSSPWAPPASSWPASSWPASSWPAPYSSLPFSPLASQARVCRLPGGTSISLCVAAPGHANLLYRASALTAYGFFI
jgi:hypothetical protein